MKFKKRDKKFIKLPTYPGGKEAFREFLKNNLKYPEAALQKKIEGTVYLKYKVNGLGAVIETEVTKGIGFGCDEEAERVIKLLKYGKAKNRGLRVIATMRTRIRFSLPTKEATVQYEYSSSTKKDDDSKKEKEPKKESYNYTITFGS